MTTQVIWKQPIISHKRQPSNENKCTRVLPKLQLVLTYQFFNTGKMAYCETLSRPISSETNQVSCNTYKHLVAAISYVAGKNFNYQP